MCKLIGESPGDAGAALQPDGLATLYDRWRCLGTCTMESVAREGAVIDADLGLRVGQRLEMIVALGGRSLRTSVSVVREYRESRGRRRWSVKFQNLDQETEGGLVEVLQSEQAARSRRPLVVVLGHRHRRDDPLLTGLTAVEWEAVVFSRPREALRWMDTSMVSFDAILVDARFLSSTGRGYLDFLAARFPDKRRVLVLDASTAAVPQAFGTVDGVLTDPVRPDSLALALGKAAGDPLGTKRVLFVDDEPKVFDGLRLQLRRRLPDYELVWAADGAEALAAFRQQSFGTVVSDICMPGMDGVTLLSALQREQPSTFRVLLTGFEVSGARAVADRVLMKPCPTGTLADVILERRGP